MASSISSTRARTCSLLADDNLTEIFTYLPLNSVYKFKCLSKVWLSNLSNPNFFIRWFEINNKSIPWIHYHTVRSYVPTRFESAVPDLHSQFISINKHLFSFEFFMNQKQFQGATLLVLGSSNGLVLCHTLHASCQRGYHVCNPLTQSWVSLPSPPRSPACYLDLHGIYCEHSSSFASCYKVVRIPRFYTSFNKFDVDVFCSDVGAWESFQVSCDDNVVWARYNRRNAFMLNDVLFWIEEKRNRLLAYNLNQNNECRCNLINLPKGVSGGIFNDRIVGESEGWVCYAETRTEAREMTVSVWVLDEVNWKILHKDISVGGILKVCSEFAKIEVLGFSPVDRNVVLFGRNHRVWGFNIKTRNVEELCLCSRHVNCADWMHQPFVLKPMPTVLPPPSWIGNESDPWVSNFESRNQ